MTSLARPASGSIHAGSLKAGNVAFIGLGNMGSRMASRLLTAGYTVRVYDPNPEAVHGLVARGASAGDTPADTADGADFILSSLPNPAIVRAVYLAENGLAEGTKPGAVAIDFSTIDPGTVVEVARALAERNVQFLDAPVSRGITGAENGTLAIMVGGDAAALESAAPLLENLGNRITHVGPSGSGQLVKLCNNMISAITTVALGEVMVMGRSAGLEARIMFDVLTSGSADSHMLNSYFPRTIFGETRPTGFSLDFMAKDLDLFLGTGNQTPVPMLLSSLTRQIFRIAQDQGLGSRDSCSVVEFYEELAGVRLQF